MCNRTRRGQFHRPVRTLVDSSICAVPPRGANACESLHLRHKRTKKSTPTFSWFFCHFMGTFPSTSINPPLFLSGAAQLSHSGVFFCPKSSFPSFEPLRCKEFGKKCSWRDSKEQLRSVTEEYQNAHSLEMFLIAVSGCECYTL